MKYQFTSHYLSHYSKETDLIQSKPSLLLSRPSPSTSSTFILPRIYTANISTPSLSPSLSPRTTQKTKTTYPSDSSTSGSSSPVLPPRTPTPASQQVSHGKTRSLQAGSFVRASSYRRSSGLRARLDGRLRRRGICVREFQVSI